MDKMIVYETKSGKLDIQFDLENETIWLTQSQMADLFQTTSQNITLHIKSIYSADELDIDSTCKNSLQVQIEGNRSVERRVKFYNLDMVISVGYRINSLRATQFRKWATQTLREYIVKGFVLNSERLKNPAGWDYFDELLELIREIRASEKRFYQKVRDLFALSTDYKDGQGTNDFFAEVQNKLLYAVTGNTAAELIKSRANSTKPNMNLTNWSGTRVRRHDVIVAKNYLADDEIKRLDRFVSMFLDYAESQAERKIALKMSDWKSKVDSFITFNDYNLLNGKGSVSKKAAEELAQACYDKFDAERKKLEAKEADQADIKELEELEKTTQKTQSKKITL